MQQEGDSATSPREHHPSAGADPGLPRPGWTSLARSGTRPSRAGLHVPAMPPPVPPSAQSRCDTHPVTHPWHCCCCCWDRISPPEGKEIAKKPPKKGAFLFFPPPQRFTSEEEEKRGGGSRASTAVLQKIHLVTRVGGVEG